MMTQLFLVIATDLLKVALIDVGGWLIRQTSQRDKMAYFMNIQESVIYIFICFPSINWEKQI